MNCRKNVKNLSQAEKSELVQAFLDLKNPAKAPSQIPAAQSDGANSRYDDYVWLHTQVGTGAHRRPGFLAWHRKFLDLLEKDLQDISSKPHLALPYWDWSDLIGSNPFTTDFLGGDGDGLDNQVTTGAFAFSAGNWNINVDTGGAAGAYLQRTLGGEVLGDHDDTLTLLDATPLDESNWNDAGSNDAFRNRLEGWFSGQAVRFHNAGHVYVGGSMLPSSSPNDPVFFIHHANVDRLWAVWQQKHPFEPYVPGGGESATLAGHRLGDNMVLFGTHFGSEYTIDSVLDHKAGGYMYDTDIPSVTLETPSVDFGNVPVGMTTYHAIRFRVETARQVQFRITAGPSGNFSQTPVTNFTATPVCGESFIYGYVFVAYTAPGIAGPTENSSVTVEAYFTDVEGFYAANQGSDYSLLITQIDLLATPVPVQKTAVALVLDRSGSMAGTATTSSTGTPVTKAELLKDAVSVFSVLMRPEDGISVVSYDEIVDRLLNVTEMGPYSPIVVGSGRDNINTILAGSNLDPRGLTGIGAGILEGNSALADGQVAANALIPPDPYDVLAMVVMTDGNENQSPTIDNVSDSISANTFAIGLGTAGNVSEVALEKITKNNNGDLLITGDMSSSVQEFFLTKLFVQALAGVTNQDIILDPRGHLILDSKHRIPFDVTEADVDVDVIVLCRFPALLDFCLETPDGTLFQRADVSTVTNLTYVEGRRVSFYRVNLPAIPVNSNGSHAGRWHVVLKFDQQRLKELLQKERQEVIEFLKMQRRYLSYDLIIQARSNLNMKAVVQQSSHEPGAKLDFYVQLTEYNQPVDRRARIVAELTRPDGSIKTLSFTEYEPGRYRASLVAGVAGIYSSRVQAAGRTLYGKPFTREQVVSAAVHVGADLTPVGPLDDRDDANERLCHLLECIMNRKVIEPEFEKKLKKLGINIDAMRHCVKAYCETKRRVSSSTMFEPGVPPKAIREPRLTNLSEADLTALRKFDDLQKIITEFVIDHDIAETKLVIARTKQKKVEVERLADENIKSISDSDFYAKSIVNDGKSVTVKKKSD